MDSQYSYAEAQSRNNYNMIRTLQSNPLGTNYRFDGSQGGLPQNYSAPGGYAQHRSQLPPLNPRDGGSSGAGYGQVPQPRSQHASPVTHSMPFSPTYGQPQPPPPPQQQQQPPPPQPPYQPAYSASMSLPQYSPSYGYTASAMNYQSNYTSPTSGMGDFGGMTAPHGQPMPGAMAQHRYSMPGIDSDYPSQTHVVGAQGRRGILPSDEGRPQALGVKGTVKNGVVPQKDENGKFPCPHCTKTYLHAKHLKRHMLRHTGERPYTCVLCSDTFSRSDILKRHFQKCSIRRGNPTGATHLSNPSAYTKRQPNRKSSAATNDGRPATSDSGDSQASTQQSAAEETVGGMSGDHTRNGSLASPTNPRAPVQLGAYGTGTMHSSPATSPNTGRPPMGFYENGAFAQGGNNGFM